MLTPDQYRARGAFLRFQHALDSLEHEMKPLQMSELCKFEFETMGRVARSFFTLANEEIFSTQKERVFNGK